MVESSAPEHVRDFSPAQYIAPYLLLVVANAGLHRAPADDRPVLFWLFAALAALGAASTVVRLRRMWHTHRRHALPAWTRLLGAALAVYGLYVGYTLIHSMTS
ncbi:hypothetical protein [Streptomyces flavofungini]|uniref:hypothetical protein n=1 Tax=Streptomyces flavofungini TaxID=68200 RepID=UPI0034DF68B6